MQVKQLHSLTEISAADWNAVCGTGYPFLRHEFLLALEQSGCVSAATGWLTRHLVVLDGERLVAVMPLYQKSHSFGEYVFDQQWARAYQQHALAYYPKYVTSIPMTPCPGTRIAIAEDYPALAVMQTVLAFIKQASADDGISSWHCLFPDALQAEHWRSLGLSVRTGVQFQWFNQGYADFEGFLQTFTASKRKMIKRERRRVAEQGVQFIQLNGTQASPEQWQVFYEFYAQTYLKRGQAPYLNRAFFQQLAATMGEQLLLVLAVKGQDYVGGALSLIGDDTFYGRYWGCLDEYHSLHFETCYYQGLDYCIRHGLARFDSGAQGEHKIARGFKPITTYSAHWLQDPRFALAIAQFLQREQTAVQHYQQEAARYLPFKNPDA